jgi:threonine dehydrogenase-like Zn-dependent dehydrogenase
MHGYERLGAIASHETVVIQGAGPVGLYATAVARDRGAAHVYTIGAPANRLEIARALGAEETLDLEAIPDVKGRAQWVLERTDGRGADLVVQCAGTPAVPEGLDLVRPGGRYLSIGAGGSGTLPVNGNNLTTKQLQITGVLSGQDRHYYQALEFLATRTHLPFERMLTNTFPLERTEDALRAMAVLAEIKPIIQPHQN